jgi:hypothetical protein
MAKALSPHEHKLYTEILTRVRLGVRALELLHIELQDDFATLYSLTGDPVFARARDTLNAPHPIFPVMKTPYSTHQGIIQ